ncbi:MAG: hypothetical protein ACFFDW_10065 [Candidatus Thorarchaeota archaeon]
MSRKTTLIFLVIISIVIILGSISGILYFVFQNNEPPNEYPDGPPVFEFFVENPEVLCMLGAYGTGDWGFYHNGIDFMINATANIIAPCNMTVNDVVLFYNDLGGHWQVGTSFTYNEEYEIFMAFESFAENETFGQLQYDAIVVEIGQKLVTGQFIGQLFMHRPAAHIHFMIQKEGECLCPYQFFSTDAKAQFDVLWDIIGICDSPCGDTTTT